jgi:hypothetical protein
MYNKLYYGFISKDNNSTTTQKVKFDNLVGLINKLDRKFRRSGWWVGQKHPECYNIDFDNFRDPDTALLVQSEGCATLVEKLADEIDILIKHFFAEFKR